MPIIDFRIRPPYKGFLDTIMYAGAERRDRITRSVGLERLAFPLMRYLCRHRR